MVCKDIFHAIADPTRRAILALVAMQAMTPNAIAGHFNCTRQAVSKHIQILHESELLTQQQQGREIYYHFNPSKMKEVDVWLEQFRAQWESRYNNLDQLLVRFQNKSH
jgi:DNA-binding transcriptional ArsR family regulator